MLGVPRWVAGAAGQPGRPGVERSSFPTARGRHRPTRSRGASMTTSTSYSQPTASGPRPPRRDRGPAGGSKVSSPGTTLRTRSIRYARWAPSGWVRQSRYHRPWRTTTAHGSTSPSRSGPPRSGSRAARAGGRRRPARGRGRAGVRPGGSGVRGGRGGPPDAPRPARPTASGRARMILPSAPPTSVAASPGVVVAVEHGHHQAECFCGAEHQRRKSQAAADPVAAVAARGRLRSGRRLHAGCRRSAGRPAPRRPACRRAGPRCCPGCPGSVRGPATPVPSGSRRAARQPPVIRKRNVRNGV